MKYFILFFLLTTPVYSDTCTVINQNGDQNCIISANSSYTIDSQATANAKAQAQATIDAQTQSNLQIQTLIQQDEQLLAIQDLQNQGLLTSDQANAQTANLTALSSSQATAKTNATKIQ